MDFKILYAIQALRTPFLDKFILTLTALAGEKGLVWVGLGAALLPFKKTRRAGCAVLVAYGLAMGVGQYILKDWIARPRPCHLDKTVALLVKRPSSYSCPSTHTGLAFGAATAVLMYFRKWGIGAIVLAALIGFSRMYLFVHFPTDVLAGAVLGVLAGIAAAKLVDLVAAKRSARADKKAQSGADL